MTDNVIRFPREKKESSCSDDSFDVSGAITEKVLEELYRAGCRYDMVGEDVVTHFTFLFETIRSTYLLSKGVEHPIQKAIRSNLFDKND